MVLGAVSRIVAQKNEDLLTSNYCRITAIIDEIRLHETASC